jgi:hypothetical protein
MLLTATGAGRACSSLEPVTEERSFAKASAVFLAHVIRTEETEGENPLLINHPTAPMVEATFPVIEVLKGQPPADGKVRSLVVGYGNYCSIPLFAGLDYVFFVEDGNFISLLGGTRPFITINGYEPKRLIEKLRALAKQDTDR